MGEALRVSVRDAFAIPRKIQSSLLELLREQASSAAMQGDEAVYPLLEATTDFLTRFCDSHACGNGTSQEADGKGCNRSEPEAPVLGRRLVYSHHIIADEKRAAIRQEALDLQLGGCVKHGWPGIIDVEGAEANCIEYVRRIQRFRWQHLVVRGEQTVDGDPGTSFDDL